MKKLICVILAACMLFVLAACGATKPVEQEIKEWTRQGNFEDGNGNHLIVNLSETEGYEGWAVSLMLDGEAIGWIIQQEGNTLRGNLNSWDEKAEPFNVIITEEGEDGLKLDVEGGGTYHFTPMDVPEATIVVTVNIEGMGSIVYAEGETSPEIDPEFPAQSAYLGLAESAVYTFLAEPKTGNLFVKWTRNGEDYSTEPQITVLLDESAQYIAVFEEDPDWQNPVMNFVGRYQCDRANANVECFGSDEAWITIEWGSSAKELTRWIIVGLLDTDTLTITYEGASKANLVYDENGEVKREERIYDDGTGTIAFQDDGTFIWHEDQSESGTDLVFQFVPASSGSFIPGTWQTASVSIDDDGMMNPEYHVQFTDQEIIYGHRKEGDFVPDHSDAISSVEKTDTGGWRVQAEASNGVQYTYQTSENDENVMEYYETWREEAFPEMYRGGASLNRCD